MRCLTNLDRSEETQHRTHVASLRSGQNVKYIDAPMPADGATDGWYISNLRSGNLNDLGSLWAIDNEDDYSAFWDEWRKLKGNW